MADRVPWHQELTYRTGVNDTFTVSDPDIVTRLQDQLDGPIPMVVERQDVRDAIDEIERLRLELEEQRYWNGVLKEQIKYTA